MTSSQFLLTLNINIKGEAMNIEEYVPTITPQIRANEKH